MYSVVAPISKLFHVKQFITSDIYFLINTKLTVILLILFSVLLSTLDLLRTSIDCYTEGKDARKAMMDNYCWSMGTYICRNLTRDKVFRCSDPDEQDKIDQKYYQWIPLMFIIQASIFYIPAYLWKIAEGGLLHKLCDNLDASFGRASWKEKKNEVVNYFNGQFSCRAHMKYINQYIGCKLLSIITIVINMIMLDMIVPGFWATYSKATTSLFVGDVSSWTMHSDVVFPKIAKCMFTTMGPSGSPQKLDALCLLPLNVLNEKIFVIVWLWFLLQLIVSAANLIYLIIICYNKNIRIAILRHHAMMVVSRKQIAQATNKSHLGNFFLLNQIAKNTNSTTFVELISELSLNSLGSLSTVNQDVVEKSV